VGNKHPPPPAPPQSHTGGVRVGRDGGRGDGRWPEGKGVGGGGGRRGRGVQGIKFVQLSPPVLVYCFLRGLGSLSKPCFYNTGLQTLHGTRLSLCTGSVADPHHVDEDWDPDFHFDADPDPAFHSDADPDPARPSFPIRCGFMRIWICNTGKLI
jgi:hypothetical protein